MKQINMLNKQLTILALLIVALFGVNESAWADDCTYTISGKASSVNTAKYTRKKWYGTETYYVFDQENQIGSINNQYGISKIYIKATMERIAAGSGCKIKFQYKNSSGSWVDLTGENELAGYSAAIPTSTAECNLSGSDITSAISGATAFRIVETQREEYSKSRTITINDFYVVMAKTISGSETDMSFADQTYGTTSSATTRDFTFSNATTGQSISISNNTNSTEFPATIVKTGDCTGTATVSVQFRPSAQGERSGSITISGDCGSKTFTVKGNGLRANSALSMNNGSVNVFIAGINSSTLDLSTLIASQTGNGGVTYEVIGATGANATTSTATIAADKKTFSATETGVYTIRATKALTDQYNSKTDDFTVTVNKLQPTFTWRSFEHIYSGAVLTNLAQAQYNGNNVTSGLTYEYTSNNQVAAVVANDKTTINVPTTGFITDQDVRISVTTAENDYYEAGSSYNDYLIEPKKTPVFKLNGEEITNGGSRTINLYIGETATMSFEKVDETEATFIKPSSLQYVSYDHNNTNHTGVITATVFGQQTLSFTQSGNDTIFTHSCEVVVNVLKHEVALSSWLDDQTYHVDDSVNFAESYSVFPAAGTHPQSEVTFASSNDKVVKLQNGKLYAVGAGEADLTFRMENNAYWTGDTITAHVNIIKYDPVITWDIEASYEWGDMIYGAVSSTNTDVPLSVTSNNPGVANYVNGVIEVYNQVGSATFTVEQKADRKWNAATSNLTRTISVTKPNNHVPYNIGNVTLKKDNTTTKPISGVPATVKFKLSTNASADRTWKVFWSATGNSDDYHLLEEYDKGQEKDGNKNLIEYEEDLDPSTKSLKFEFAGAWNMLGSTEGTFQGVYVSQRTEIDAPSNYDFRSGYMGNRPTQRTIDVDWYSVKTCSVALSGTDASQFELITNSFDAELDRYGKAGIRVNYKHDKKGTHTAKLTITSADVPAKTAEITLTGTTNKAIQTIICREDITPISLGKAYEEAIYATSGLDVVLTAETPNIVEIDGTTITGVGVGTTRIFAAQAGSTTWEAVNETISVQVTDKKVQHIKWKDRLGNLKRENGQTVTKTLNATSDADRTITYELDNDAKAFASVSGNTLTITGWGTGTITAKQDGGDEYVTVTKTLTMASRNPNSGCNPLVLQHDSEESIFQYGEKEYDLSGEPAKITFNARRQTAAIKGIYVDEYYGGKWHNINYETYGTDYSDNPFGPFDVHREATKIRFRRKVGATLNGYFKDVKVTLAKYLELVDNNMDFSAVEYGQVVYQEFYVSYSNISGVLDVELANESQQLEIVTETLGNECGEVNHYARVQVRCVGRNVGDENNTIVISNRDQRLEIPVSVKVIKKTQVITWNDATEIGALDGDIELHAVATSELEVTYTTGNEAIATVYKENGKWYLHPVKGGEVRITASQAGTNNYSAADDVAHDYTISLATPVVTAVPTASVLTAPNLALSNSELTDGSADVPGEFVWENSATVATLGTYNYAVVFIPTDGNHYEQVTCSVAVTANKAAQEITWNVANTNISCDANITFDATAGSGLNVTYVSSDDNIAYVDKDNNNKLNIIKGGDVTITAKQSGNETYLAAEDVAYTFHISKFTPVITTIPSVTPVKISKLLDNATINNDGVVISGNEEVDGSFSWVEGSKQMTVAGPQTERARFTPTNSNYYSIIEFDLEVTVEKFAPDVESSLTGSTITYGQPLSESELTGTVTATDNVQVPSVTVEGTCAWVEPSAKLDAGENMSAKVRFTPTNTDWYNTVDFDVTLTVNQAEPVLNVTASDIVAVQKLSASVLTNNGTPGTCAWKAELNPNTATYAEGNYNLGYIFTPTNPNYLTKEGLVALHVAQGCVITGNNSAAGEAWENESNWESTTTPNASDHVLVKTNLEIVGDVTVGALTIEEGKTIVVKDGGSLTITGEENAMNRAAYGDIRVENNGTLVLENEADIKVKDFSIEASQKTSGQIKNPENIDIQGNAYIDITISTNTTLDEDQWYGFTVPFPVDAKTGVERILADGTVESGIVWNDNYVIASYDSQRRASGNKGWRAFSGVMTPGVFYLLGIDNQAKIYRFHKTNTGSIVAANEMALQSYPATGKGDNGDANWNAVGNPALCYSHASCPVDFVQIYDNNTGAYEPAYTAASTFVVGRPFFIQNGGGTLSLSAADGSHSAYYAPRRSQAKEVRPISVLLENDGEIYDRIFVRASEDATGEYVIGRDLQKLGTTTKKAQMWINALGKQLCVREETLNGDVANYNLSIYAPEYGSYMLSIDETLTPDDATLYLTYNDNIIWDLTASPYQLDLDKGTTNGYGLRMEAKKAPTVTTDVEETESSQSSVRKVIIDNKIYIVTPEGKMYDIIGKSVKY